MGTLRKMTQGVESNTRKKREDLKRISKGLHPAVLYSVIKLGTQPTKFGDKRQIMLTFEFPGFKQLWYEDDKEERPQVISLTLTDSLHPKGNLFKIVSNLVDNLKEGDTIDWSEIVGTKVFVTIDYGGNEGQYDNITQISPFNPQMAGNIDMTLHNDLFIYDIDWGFECEEFTEIPDWIRKKIISSQEGIKHAENNGAFAPRKQKEYEDNSNVPKAPKDNEIAKPKHLPDLESTSDEVDDLPF